MMISLVYIFTKYIIILPNYYCDLSKYMYRKKVILLCMFVMLYKKR